MATGNINAKSKALKARVPHNVVKQWSQLRKLMKVQLNL